MPSVLYDLSIRLSGVSFISTFTNTWLRRAVIVATIGGSFAGVQPLWLLVSRGVLSHIVLVPVFAFFVAYMIWGLAIGIGITEGRAAYKQLVVWLALQVPYVVSPVLGYRVAIGPQLIAGYYKGSYTVYGTLIDIDVSMRFGRQDFVDPSEIALNLVPIILIALLMRARRQQS